MKPKTKEWKLNHELRVSVGIEIGSQDPSTPIKVVENTQPNQTGFVARVFHRASENKWVASTTNTTKGLVVYLEKKPRLGQKIKITEVHERYATGAVVTPSF